MKQGFILIEIIFFFLLMSLLFSILSTPLQSLTHSLQSLTIKKQTLHTLKNELETYLATGESSFSLPYSTLVVDELTIYQIQISSTNIIEILSNE